MKKLLLALALLLLAPVAASAQCNGVFGANQICGSVAGGLPGPVNSSSFPAVSFGTNIQTTNYQIATSDCNKTVQMGTGTTGLKTLTLPAPSGFPEGCYVIFKNGDTGRGKKLSGFPVGLTSPNILWQLQAGVVQIVNGAWKIIQDPGPYQLQAPTELCVRQDGDNTSDGLGDGTVAADCLADPQVAVQILYQYWRGQQRFTGGSIGLYAGGTSTFGPVTMTGQPTGFFATFNIRANVSMSCTTFCFSFGDNGNTIVNSNLGFTLTMSCNTSNGVKQGCFYIHQNGVYDINGSFVWIPGGTNDSFAFADAQGRMTITLSGAAGLTVGDGSARTFNDVIHCDDGCSQIQTSGIITFAANVTGARVHTAFNQGIINASATYVGTFTGAGPSYIVNSTLVTNSITDPGGAPTLVGSAQACTTFSGPCIGGMNNFLGTAAPADAAGQTFILGTLVSPTMTNNGQGAVYNTAGSGLNLQGKGSANDCVLRNGANSPIFVCPTGTTIVNFTSPPKISGNVLTQISVNLGTINFNSVADTTVTVPAGPNASAYIIAAVRVYSCTAAITSAAFGLFTAVTGGGIQIVPPTTGTVTATTAATAANLQNVGGALIWLTQASLFFRVTTAQGSAVTCAVSVTVTYL